MRKSLGLFVGIALSVWLFQPSTASASLCGGSPCPTIHGQVPDFMGGSSTEEPVWLTRELFDEVEAINPDAASLLSSLASDPDALSVGLRDRIPFQAGDFKGMMSVPSGQKDKPRVYRYEASVIPMDGGVNIHIKVLDHPSLRGLDAQIWNGMSGTYVELRDKTGPSRRIDF